MVAQVETAWIKTYRDTVEGVLQQKDSRFAGKVSEDSYVGEGARPVMRVGEAATEEITTRGETKTEKELDLEARWITPRDWDAGPYREYDIDKVRHAAEFTGHWGVATKKAYNRRKDDLIIAAATGSAQTGKDGTGAAATFDTTNMRVTSGSAGMTVAKLREMKRRFEEQEVDLDEEALYCAISAKQHDNLLADIQVTSRDFNGGAPVLEKGMISQFMGFTFVRTQRLGTVSSERRCITWTPKGLHLGTWKEWEADVDINKRIRGNPVESYFKFKMNACRLDEKRVGEILCAE